MILQEVIFAENGHIGHCWELGDMWSHLSQVVTLVTGGHIGHRGSHWSQVVTLVTCGHIGHRWSFSGNSLAFMPTGPQAHGPLGLLGFLKDI